MQLQILVSALWGVNKLLSWEESFQMVKIMTLLKFIISETMFGRESIPLFST